MFSGMVTRLFGSLFSRSNRKGSNQMEKKQNYKTGFQRNHQESPMVEFNLRASKLYDFFGQYEALRNKWKEEAQNEK